MKTCKLCNETKPYEDFHASKKEKDGHHTWCKVCKLDHARWKHLENRYGITKEQYNQKFEEQKGCCDICGVHQMNFKHALAVDHNHTTGKVRGLLCGPCNTAIGKLKEDKKLFLAAIAYLEKHD